jgi:hypothetical protein
VGTLILIEAGPRRREAASGHCGLAKCDPVVRKQTSRQVIPIDRPTRPRRSNQFGIRSPPLSLRSSGRCHRIKTEKECSGPGPVKLRLLSPTIGPGATDSKAVGGTQPTALPSSLHTCPPRRWASDRTEAGERILLCNARSPTRQTCATVVTFYGGKM